MALCRIIRGALWKIIAFALGFALGQLFYYCMLRDIPFPGNSGRIFSFSFSTLLGSFNVISNQFRCISVLKFPMYCGKPGRGVLKAMILTYIVTGDLFLSCGVYISMETSLSHASLVFCEAKKILGPITNMGLNAKEVVRLFACSTQLAYNLSRAKYELRLGPAMAATQGVRRQLGDIKNAFRSMADIIVPLEQEIEDTNETKLIQYENNLIDDYFEHKHRSDYIEAKFLSSTNSNGSVSYESLYRKKLQYRCENQLSRGSALCAQRFTKVYLDCCNLMPHYSEYIICSPFKQKHVCDLMTELSKRSKAKEVCEAPTNLGLDQKFVAFKKLKTEFVDKLNDVNLESKIIDRNKMLDLKDAKDTAERVQKAFEDKIVMVRHVKTAMNICIALLFLRIFSAAIKYHDLYLTSIDYDNVYVTDYFKIIDARRRNSNKYTLLPLKKMERYKYIDVYSLSSKESQRSNLRLHILKVLLEVVTATTFVMLDRLFYEALEVVRQHADTDVQPQGSRDLDIQVEGTGMLAAMLHSYLADITAPHPIHQVSSSACLPHPRQMPYIYFLKIYGGYTWIVILLFANPYTMRLRRLICSHFYPRREKERILHLYNDILKKRMKMHKTLRRKAVQAVRAHYLSGDVLSLLNMRMKFPQFLGWLRALPAARMSCLICGETEPRSETQSQPHIAWHTCLAARCPFVYCAECWREIGSRCLACEPSLAELSDVDSHTDDEPNKY